MIEIRRGTTKEIVIALAYETGSEYKIEDTDTLIFGVKTSVNQKEYIFSRTVDKTAYSAQNGGYLIQIQPEDTANMLFGDFVYDVGLQKQNGEFHIVCPCDLFKVSAAVTKRVPYAED